MATVQLGPYAIPVVGEYEVSSLPTNFVTLGIIAGVPTLTEGQKQQIYRDGDCYGNFTLYVKMNDFQPPNLIQYLWSAFEVSLHNEASVKFSGPQVWEGSGGEAFAGANVQAFFQSSQTENAQEWKAVNGNYDTHFVDRDGFRDYYLGAIKITYRDHPEYPAGYQFIGVNHEFIENPITGDTIVDRLNISGGFYICPQKWVSAYNIDAYFDTNLTPDDEAPFDEPDPDPYNDHPDEDTSDTIDIPVSPSIGVSNIGFINVYKPSVNALTNLGVIIFPNVASATDVLDAIIKLCETIANSNLINYVIDCHVIPVTPTTGSNANIKVGFRDTEISAPKVTSDYVDVSCGSLNLAEWFHGYQDYQATKSKLYLPFIGFIDVKPEFWQAGTISVDYKFNIIDGSFMCYVRSTSSKSNLSNSIIAQYAGNACMHFPLTGVNYSNMVSGLVGAAVTAASAGTAVGALGAAMSAANTIAQGGDVQQSNGYNSTAALLGVRVPYLMIERAVPAFPGYYAHDKGYPANISTLLGRVSGFTVIDDIDLSGIPLTEGELSELRGLLKEGVYF